MQNEDKSQNTIKTVKKTIENNEEKQRLIDFFSLLIQIDKRIYSKNDRYSSFNDK